MTHNHLTDDVGLADDVSLTNGVGTTRSGPYRIFILTCWQEEVEDLHGLESWRFRLEEPRTGARRGCVGVTRLVALLCDQIADSPVSVSISTEVKESSSPDST